MARVLVREIKQDKKNYILNSNFGLWQRGTTTVTGLGAVQQYHADRFQWAAGTITGQVSSIRAAITGYSNSTIVPRTCSLMQQYSVTTAQASLSAGSTAGPWIKVEGFDIQDMLEQGALSSGFILSFYVASSVTGTYTVQFANSGLNNHYFSTYTITSANTWQRVNIKLTAAEVLTGISSGTWDFTNGIGMYIRFWLAAGTGAQGVNQNVWTSVGTNVPAAQANVLSAVSNTWGITGIMLNVGNTLPDFRMRNESQAQELRACQRYYEKSYDVDVNLGTVTSAGQQLAKLAAAVGATGALARTVDFKVTKRGSPSVLLYSPATGASQTSSIAGIDRNTIVSGAGTNSGTPVNNTGGSIGAAGDNMTFHYFADAEL